MINWMPGMTLEGVEKHIILQAIAFYHGNKTTTAKALGCSTRTLYDKLEKYEVDKKVQDERDERAKQDRYDFDRRQRGLPVDTSQRGYTGPVITDHTGRVASAQTGSCDERVQSVVESKEDGPNSENGAKMPAGVRLEPVTDSIPQQPVSVLKREEVQGVPFKRAPENSHAKRR